MGTTAEAALAQAKAMAAWQPWQPAESRASNGVEKRLLASSVEIRSGSSRTIGGYAAKFNAVSQNLGGFVERIAPGTFDRSWAAGWPDVVARYNHEDNMLLGTIAGGTLRLVVDRAGLVYDVDLPMARADVLELVQRGDVTQSSFAFVAAEDEWSTSGDGYPLRTLTSLVLHDVAPVNSPAYKQTSVGARSLARHFHLSESEAARLLSAGEVGRLLKPSSSTIDLGETSAHRALAIARALMDGR